MIKLKVCKIFPFSFHGNCNEFQILKTIKFCEEFLQILRRAVIREIELSILH